jgi:hypothetical protein
MNDLPHQPKENDLRLIRQYKTAPDLLCKKASNALRNYRNAFTQNHIHISTGKQKLNKPANTLNITLLSKNCPFFSHVINYKSVFARGSPSLQPYDA